MRACPTTGKLERATKIAMLVAVAVLASVLELWLVLLQKENIRAP